MAEKESYAEELANTLTELREDFTEPLGKGIPTTWAELVKIATSLGAKDDKSEVFIEVDRQLIEQVGYNGEDALLPYLYPVAVRVDGDGDVIITITDADRAQS